MICDLYTSGWFHGLRRSLIIMSNSNQDLEREKLVELREIEDVIIESPTTARPMVVARRVREAATKRRVVKAAMLGNHVMTMNVGDRVHVMSADFSFHPIYGGESGMARYAKNPGFHSFQF